MESKQFATKATRQNLPNLYGSVFEDAELNMDIFGELEADWLFLTPKLSRAISLANVDSTFSVVIRFSCCSGNVDTGIFLSVTC